MPRSTAFRRALALLAVLAALAGLTPPAGAAPAADAPAADAPAYAPPVDGPVTDEFRPPETPYGPGNRGIDYAPPPGTPVLAAASGVVVFAGQVGGSIHVVVLHDDGVRTTYSFLAQADVRRGQHVDQGQPVGVAGSSLHFGARVGERYIDPRSLFVRARHRTRLLPDDGKGLPPEAAERGALERLVRALRVLRAVRAGPAAAAASAVAAAAAIGLDDPDLGMLASLAQAGVGLPAAALTAWVNSHGGCTPGSAPTPPRLRERRLAVLVAGLGSASGRASILDLPVGALGYAPADTVQFSYRGGTTSESSYGPADTQADLDAVGARLRTLLARLAAQHPGVPIDVFAHSQGGLVARAALREPVDGVRHLVMLGTPNRGAPLAAVLDNAVHRAPTAAVGPALAAARPLGLDPYGPTGRDLRPASDFLRSLGPAPRGVRVTSIGARTDVVVPSDRAWLRGAANVVVSAPGLNAHARLPGSSAARREVALAVHDRPATCRSVIDALLDAAAATSVELAETAAGAAVTAP
jgi:murein DD-endopeptidase MepM/ murein hydrolase activator NlpD